MNAPAPQTVLVLAVVGTKANKLVKASSTVHDVNVSSRPQDRIAYVVSKFSDYGVTIDRNVAQ